MLPSSGPPSGWAGEFSCPCVVKACPGIFLLSSLEAGCGSHATQLSVILGYVSCFYLHSLLLSKPAFLSNHSFYKGLPWFFFPIYNPIEGLTI